MDETSTANENWPNNYCLQFNADNCQFHDSFDGKFILILNWAYS